MFCNGIDLSSLVRYGEIRVRPFFNFFPLRSTGILGIDITAKAIKLLHIIWVDGNCCIQNYFIDEIPSGLVESDGLIHDIDFFIVRLSQLLRKVKPICRGVNLSIADACTITKIIQVSNKLNLLDIEELVSQEVTKLISCPLADISFDFKLLDNPQQQMQDLLIVASRAEYIKQRIEIFQRVGLKILAIDIESNAILRVLKFISLNSILDDTVAWLDIGALHIKFFVFHKFRNIFSQEDGFSRDSSLEGDNSWDILLVIIKRNLKFFSSSENYKVIRLMFLSGGSFYQESLLSFLSKNLAIDLRIVNPFANFSYRNKDISDLIQKDFLRLITVLGLAFKE